MRMGLLLVVVAAGCASSRQHATKGGTGSDADSLRGIVAPPRPDELGPENEVQPAGSGSDELDRARGADEPTDGGRAPSRAGQPDWTMHRRFATTPAYVLAPGQIQFQQWVRTHTPRNSSPTHWGTSEVGMGFEGGLEARLGEHYDRRPDRDVTHRGVSGTVGYAFGQWGELPLNPAVYGGVQYNHRAPADADVRLAVADDFCGSDWIWAADASWTEELGGQERRDLGAAAGIAYQFNQSMSLGAEARYDHLSVEHARDDGEHRVLVGPSFQWRPTDNTHLDVVPLFGFTHDDRRNPRMQLFLVFGIDFGPDKGRSNR